MTRLATYTTLVVLIFIVVAVVDGNVISLARHKVQINPCRAELAVREDAAQTTYTGLGKFCLPLEALVDHRNTSYILMIFKIVEGFTRLSDIDIVERVLDILIDATNNLKHPALGSLLVHIGAQRRNHIDSTFYFVSMLPNDGISVAQLRVLRILAAHQPHLLVFIGANTLRALIRAVVGYHLQ